MVVAEALLRGDIVGEMGVIGIDPRVQERHANSRPRESLAVDRRRAYQCGSLSQGRVQRCIEIDERALRMGEQRVHSGRLGPSRKAAQ